MKPAKIIGMATLSLLLATTAPAWAQQGKPDEGQGNPAKQDTGKGQAKARKQQDKEQTRKAAPAKREQQPQEAQPPDRNQKQQQANQQRADQKQADKQQAKANQQQANQQRPAQHQQQVRLSKERQQQLITEQQGRVIEYRQHLDLQQLRANQYAARLQQQKRTANHRYHQAYLARMRQQQLALQRSYDYYNDPYFYTAPSYRYSRGGRFYETNEYGANVLREAINNGYAEGYRAGQADRQDRWASDYRNSYAYQDANYGYDGYYVNQAEYNYYFREGFNRGYQDGYDSRTQYGRYSNGSGSILGAILSEILNLQSMR